MRNKVLVVDDMELNREILVDILASKYEVLEAANGKEALSLLEKNRDEIAIVLLDIVMPVMDGYEVLEIMKERKALDKIPVLVITSEYGEEVEQRCFEYGVSDFVKKPFNKNIVLKRVCNVADLYIYKDELEETVAAQTKELRSQNRKLREQALYLEETNRKMIDILGTVVESRNLESGLHIKRVKGYTKILARQVMLDYPEYGLTPYLVERITFASALHDIGKIAIPDNILLKPMRLSPGEHDFMKTHTLRGCELLDQMKDVWDKEYGQLCYDICRYHHERYDGSGYPDHLKGDQIPIAAQIVAVADVYDALVSERVYKKAYSKETAFEMITKGECGVFSPKIMDCFCKVIREFEQT